MKTYIFYNFLCLVLYKYIGAIYFRQREVYQILVGYIGVRFFQKLLFKYI